MRALITKVVASDLKSISEEVLSIKTRIESLLCNLYRALRGCGSPYNDHLMDGRRSSDEALTALDRSILEQSIMFTKYFNNIMIIY